MNWVERAFEWLESSDVSLWVRGPSVWVFPLILVFHTIGMALVAGIGGMTGLRILGFPPNVPLSAMEKFYPAFWIGLAINAASGVLLFIGYPYKAATNPVFYLKLSCIALGVYLVVKVRREVLRAPYAAGPAAALAIPRHAITLGWLSILAWAGAITAGRLLAYTFIWLRVGIPGGF
jgi:hypothetical protein